MVDVVRTFRRGKKFDRGGDEFDDLVEATRTRGAQKRLELGEGQFDGIQVRTVRRQEAQGRAGRFDRPLHLALLMGRQIVRDHDVAWAEPGHQYLLGVGKKRGVVDGAIEHGGHRHAVDPQASNQGVGLPVAAGREITEPRAAGTPAVAAEQVGRDAALIKKDELRCIAERLALTPPATRRDNIRSALLGGVYRFF